jgi:hypothetical protein
MALSLACQPFVTVAAMLIRVNSMIPITPRHFPSGMRQVADKTAKASSGEHTELNGWRVPMALEYIGAARRTAA